MGYRLRDHTADIGIEAEADTLGRAFAHLADGMAAAQSDDLPPTGERFTIEVTAENPHALLFDLLDQLIYERDVRNVLPTDHEVTVTSNTNWTANATARGIPLDTINAREIKAVTYSEMTIEETDTGWYVYVVLDV